jgi:hypothetical protein
MAVRCGTSIFRLSSRLVLSCGLFLTCKLVTSALSSVVSFADNSRGRNQSPPRSGSARQRLPFDGSVPSIAPIAGRRPAFLIANLELKFRVSPIRINDLKFPNRKFSAISCPEERRVYREARRFQPAPPSSCPWLLATHPPSLTAFLIETPRLEFSATPTKKSSLPISNRDKNALFAPQKPAIGGIPRSTLVVSPSLTQETQ